MNIKKIATAVAVLGSVMVISAPASALTILDGWQVNLPGGNTNNIGHLVVSGGQTTITQELDAGGNIAVGSNFQNFGGFFSITYTPENSVGASDFGAPGVLSNTLEYSFSGLAGTITAVNGNAISFEFTPGVGSADLSIVGGGGTIATFTPQDPSGGSLGNFFGAVNSSGTSNLLFQLASVTDPALFQEADGTNLLPGSAYFALDTTNQIFTPATAPFSCEFSASGFCSELVVTQQGKIDALVQRVPEPSVMALLGLGLLGFGVTAVRRRS